MFLRFELHGFFVSGPAVLTNETVLLGLLPMALVGPEVLFRSLEVVVGCFYPIPKVIQLLLLVPKGNDDQVLSKLTYLRNAGLYISLRTANLSTARRL